MEKNSNITFFAYGTNISQTEMKSHSETAEFIGYGTLPNYALRFKGFPEHAIATLEKSRGDSVPIAIYDLSVTDRFTLDNFEKFPYAYKKEKVKAMFNGKAIKGYVYTLKIKLDKNLPNEDYLKALKLAYFEAGFEDDPIDNAIVDCGGTPSAEGDLF